MRRPSITPHEISWPQVSSRLADLRELADQGLLDMLDDGTLRHYVTRAVVETGIAPQLIGLDPDVVMIGIPEVVVMRAAVLIGVGPQSWDRKAARSRVADILRLLATATADSKMLITLTENRSHAVTHGLLPTPVRGTQPTEVGPLPEFDDFWRHTTIEVTSMATEAVTPTHLSIFEIGKLRV